MFGFLLPSRVVPRLDVGSDRDANRGLDKVRDGVDEIHGARGLPGGGPGALVLEVDLVEHLSQHDEFAHELPDVEAESDSG